jgi:large subunit ribosomal protein L21
LTGVYGPAITAPIGVFDTAISAATPPTVSRTDWKNPVRAVTRAWGLVVEDLERGTNMFAVFKTGGKQYRVAAEDVLKIGKVKGEPGEIVEFGEVLVVGGEGVTLGAPTVAGATVAAEVLEQARGPKIIAFKKRRRKNSRRKIGHRQEFTARSPANRRSPVRSVRRLRGLPNSPPALRPRQRPPRTEPRQRVKLRRKRKSRKQSRRRRRKRRQGRKAKGSDTGR